MPPEFHDAETSGASKGRCLVAASTRRRRPASPLRAPSTRLEGRPARPGPGAAEQPAG
ncbi:MAG TPA: hypothetical protein VMG13_17275 [Trebonia sp.]|nr:hypothetical protein [Trebonia sp.]